MNYFRDQNGHLQEFESESPAEAVRQRVADLEALVAELESRLKAVEAVAAHFVVFMQAPSPHPAKGVIIQHG